MPKILVKSGDNKGKVYQVREEAVTIGRDAGQTITFSDKRVSREHAVIEFKDGKYLIRDNHSTNGTLVNGAPISEKILEFGDEIRIGHNILAFLSLSAPESIEEESSLVTFLPEEKGLDGMTVEMAIAPEQIKPLPKPDKVYQRLDILYQISQDIGSFLELPDLLSRIIDLSSQAVKCGRGTIMLIDRESGELVPQAVSLGQEKRELVVSRTIINNLLRTGKSILVSDAMRDERFKDAESVNIQKIRSAMCVPIRSKDSIIGVMYVDSQLSVMGFSQNDLELLTAICNQVGVAIENARLFDDLKKAYKELKEKQEELIESEKMAALGRLSSGITHEVKNPLTGIIGYAQMMLRDLEERRIEQDKIKENMKVIEREAQRCMSLLRNLLEFSRRKSTELRPVNINQVVEAALIFLNYHILKQDAVTKIIKNFDPNLPEIKADPDQLEQVFLNLCMNAKDAMPSGGTLTIVTRKTDEEVLIDFVDTGCGIPNDIKEKIFKPLFTTKGEGKGTGLGLSVSKDIIERHKGVIEVNSQVGKGTTFTVHLPLRAE